MQSHQWKLLQHILYNLTIHKLHIFVPVAMDMLIKRPNSVDQVNLLHAWQLVLFSARFDKLKF